MTISRRTFLWSSLSGSAGLAIPDLRGAVAPVDDSCPLLLAHTSLEVVAAQLDDSRYVGAMVPMDEAAVSFTRDVNARLRRHTVGLVACLPRLESAHATITEMRRRVAEGADAWLVEDEDDVDAELSIRCGDHPVWFSKNSLATAERAATGGAMVIIDAPASARVVGRWSRWRELRVYIAFGADGTVRSRTHELRALLDHVPAARVMWRSGARSPADDFAAVVASARLDSTDARQIGVLTAADLFRF